jgi:Putative MetA-pathway of phenol degradation
MFAPKYKFLGGYFAPYVSVNVANGSLVADIRSFGASGPVTMLVPDLGATTKNKGTSANVFVDWEAHSKKSGTNITPGRAVTTEWGLGQALLLSKNMSKIVQIGFVGYDQWQVSNNSGAARLLPYYSVHALGAQGNFNCTKAGTQLFFKYYAEVSAKARPQGRTIVFGGLLDVEDSEGLNDTTRLRALARCEGEMR